ncbi:hypothetical protein EV693_11823 [Nicoletella semolina]|uniref:Membrane protein YczE n=1 Tax=Nicoletella semolina TaxID=271160 RepID=A0A4R2N4K4_9PAST|nr:YitT family protein [Nicoletella semolina]MDH2925080.1 hypothetical protein [Nicoletella semolina]TCP15403.1 hypothetical protein EV693_11823 [Nicoletella semolina]
MNNSSSHLAKPSDSTKSPIPSMPWAAKHQWHFSFPTLCVICVAMTLMGVGEGVLVLANLGSSPWTVFSQGIALQTGASIGIVVALVSIVVLLLWIPLKLRFGLGTILNILIIAFSIDFTVRYFPSPDMLVTRIIYMTGGILLFGVSTTFYLSCKLGAGPRDGLMVGLCQKFGWKIALVRTCIEISVCFLGFLFGGTVGISTVAFALCVGWVIQFTARYLHWYYKRFE